MLFAGDHFTAKTLTSADEPALQDLFVRCTDFFDLVEGEPPSPTAAHDTFSELPPGKSPEDKLMIGLWNSANHLIGVIDLVRGYPDPGEWFIGLLLLDPAKRGLGLGQSVCKSLKEWAKQGGAETIGLAVVEGNTAALRFWTRIGFQEVRRSEPRPFGQRTWVVIYMRCPA